jgi:hypothetical protein
MVNFQGRSMLFSDGDSAPRHSANPSGEGLDEDPGESPLVFSLPAAVTSNRRFITQEQWLFQQFEVCSF